MRASCDHMRMVKMSGSRAVDATVGVLVCIAVCLVGPAQGTNYTVGAGFVGTGNAYTWTNTVEGLLKPAYLEAAYQQWASSVVVTVGDTLTFEYPLGSHTVFMVKNDAAFLNCDFAGAVQVPDGFPTSYTVKSTDTALYFVCNIPGHCLQGGQKVKVTPVGTSAGALSPPAKASSAPQQHSPLVMATAGMALIVSSLFALG